MGGAKGGQGEQRLGKDGLEWEWSQREGMERKLGIDLLAWEGQREGKERIQINEMA